METSFDREYLLGKINRLKSIVKNKTLMPVCKNILITMNPGSGEMRATDIEISAVTPLKSSDVQESATIMVPGTLLADILGSIKERDVTLITAPDCLLIRAGDFKADLLLADPNEFPAFEPVCSPETFSLSGNELARGIAKTLYAISTDESRLVLMGLLMQIKDGKLVVCATDGYRMALWQKKLSEETNDTPQIVIPGRNVKILKEIIGDTPRVGVYLGEKRVQFMTDTVTVQLNTFDLAFPHYENILPHNTAHVALAQRRQLLDAIARTEPLAKSKTPYSFSLQRSIGGLVVAMESDTGRTRERIDCQYTTEAILNYSFNVKFMLDALEHIDGDQIIMNYPETYGSCILTSDPVDGRSAEEYTCVVMPLQIEPPPLMKEHNERNESMH